MTIEPPSTNTCPDCAEEIRPDAEFCPYCGFGFVSGEACERHEQHGEKESGLHGEISSGIRTFLMSEAA